MKLYEASVYGSLFEDPSEESSMRSRFFTSLAESRSWARELADSAIAGMSEEEREMELHREANRTTVSDVESYDYIEILRIEITRMPLRQLAVRLLNQEKYVAGRERVLRVFVKGLKVVEEKGLAIR
jgi:hypothetical protein